MRDRNGQTLQDAISKAREKEIRRVAREEMVTDWAAILFIGLIAFLVTVVAPTLDAWARGF